MATPLPVLDTSGLTIPTYEDYYQYLAGQYKSLYGEDIYIDNDSQDGQLIQIQALAMSDTARVLQSLYQSFSPTYALGAGLSRLVKINNIRRKSASYSTCTVTLVGTAGTVIRDGQVKDVYDNIWDLPAEITIPYSGQISVTATAQKLGSILLSAGQLNIIVTPTRGWQSVTNTAISSPGRQIESDRELKVRREKSTMIAATGPLDAIAGRIANIEGVIQSVVYENPTDSTDSRGLPGHSIAAIVYGGSDEDIANAIFDTKTIGARTYGTTSKAITDTQGIVSTVNFFRPTVVYPYVKIILTQTRDSIDQDILNNVATAVADYLSTLTIGFSLPTNRLYSVIYNQDANLANPSFNIQQVTLSRDETTWVDTLDVNYTEMIVGDVDRIEVYLN